MQSAESALRTHIRHSCCMYTYAPHGQTALQSSFDHIPTSISPRDIWMPRCFCLQSFRNTHHQDYQFPSLILSCVHIFSVPQSHTDISSVRSPFSGGVFFSLAVHQSVRSAPPSLFYDDISCFRRLILETQDSPVLPSCVVLPLINSWRDHAIRQRTV